MAVTRLELLSREILSCRRCPRLVRWREHSAREKVRRFAEEEYWGKPLTGFGDRRGRILLVGLAPGAHGGNRTGRMFTGDESGRWLFRALHRAGLAFLPTSESRRDGQTLTGCYITAAVRCAPPKNRPLPAEFARCRPFLLKEIDLLPRVRVVIGLGKIGFDSALEAYRATGKISFRTRPAFGHGVEYRLGDLLFLGSYHPSQQNTFTGRLTEAMLDRIFRRAVRGAAQE
jgi:uracil-DNA glycosylase